ncbi:hypothetical protein B0J11DRAFT_523978 [Dendryphion nanum]|uniref:Uncharacterized protein n=1 Tax=Dendryphion nanum TaxID=256645 RepID=A0A9P9E1V0_9PLEO|nr:hypothetical protein B0J11DRAFT_523978 [Dendryphion nanum]
MFIVLGALTALTALTVVGGGGGARKRGGRRKGHHSRKEGATGQQLPTTGTAGTVGRSNLQPLPIAMAQAATG